MTLAHFPETWHSPVTRSLNPEAILFARLALNWSQRRMAEYVGVRRESISNWERGIFSPSADHALILSELIQATKTMLKDRKLKPSARFYHYLEDRIERTNTQGRAP